MRVIFSFILVFTVMLAQAQDQIFKRDNTKVEAKILEINTTEIKYKLFTYQDGPTIIISKSDVAMILYANGTFEVFNASNPVQQSQAPVFIDGLSPNSAAFEKQRKQEDSIHKAELKAKLEEYTVHKNLVMFNMLECMNGGVGVSYLREFGNHNFNVYVPLSFGFAPPGFTNSTISEKYSQYGISNYHFRQKTVDIGVGIHFQTSSNRRITHFVGPLFSLAQYNCNFTTPASSYYNGYNYSYVPPVEHGCVINRYSMMIDNGVLFRITPRFNFMIHAAIGFHEDIFIANSPEKYGTNPYYYNNSVISYPFNTFKAGFNFGYRF